MLPGDRFTWECETEIDPKANTALEGLYISRNMYCTQCEAEGFRKITFYPDRPDVMARFRVRIEADRATAPVLLANGNPTAGFEVIDQDTVPDVKADPLGGDLLERLVPQPPHGVFDSAREEGLGGIEVRRAALVAACFQVATHTVFRSRSHPSYLELSVVP